MICPYCNKENPDGTFFCVECGMILEDFTPKTEPKTEPEETDSSYTSFVDEEPAAPAAPIEPAVEAVPATPVEPASDIPAAETTVVETLPAAALPVVEEIPASTDNTAATPIAEAAPAEAVPAAITPVVEVIPAEKTAAPAASVPAEAAPVPMVTAPVAPVVDTSPTITAPAITLPPVPTPVVAPTQPAKSEQLNVSDKTLVSVAGGTAAKKKLPVPLPAIIGGAAGIVVVIVVVIVLIATAPARRYQKAMKAWDNGDYEKAAAEFEAMGNFKDAVDRAAEATAEMHYSKGKKAFEDGDYETAKAEFTEAGSYKDAADMVKESEKANHYISGCSLLVSGKYDSAIIELNKAEGYKDSETLIKRCYFELGEIALANNNLDEATEYYKRAGNYQNASEKSSEISYNRGNSAYNSGNFLEAANYFAQAGNFSDAEQRAKELYYKLGNEAFDKKDYDNASNYLKLAGDHLDASEKAKVAAYNSAAIYLKSKDYEKAGKYLALAGDYKNAEGVLLKCIQNFVKAKDYDNARKMAVSYTGDNAGSWNSYIDGMIAFTNKDFITAANSFRAAGDFLNAVVCYKSSNYNQGLAYVKVKDFSSARSFFAAGDDYSYSKDLIHLCDAEIHYAAGRIAKASQEYAKINKKTKISQFDIWGRKVHVDARVTLERAKGNYEVKSNIIYVKRTETAGYSDEKYAPNPMDGQYLTLSFTMNSNGTFDITIELTYARYVNYSYYSSDAKTELRTITKTFKKQKKLPTSIKLDNNTTLRFAKSVFTLVYTKNVENGTYIDQFSSTVSYNKVKA